MKDEYDFSSAQRGRFYQASAALTPPVHLERDVLVALEARAASERVSLNQLVNALLRADIEGRART